MTKAEQQKYDGTIAYADMPERVFFWRENPHSGAIDTFTDDEPSPLHCWDSRKEMLGYVEARGGIVLNASRPDFCEHLDRDEQGYCLNCGAWLP